MTRRLRPEEIFLLPKLGIPLDGEVLKGLKGISISQSYWDCDGSAIYDLGDHIGVVLDLTIKNDSPDLPVRLDLRYMQVYLPWCEPFRWIKGPKKIQGHERYSLGGLPARWFDPEAVLNHHLTGRELLLPKQELNGSLLGIGERSFPFLGDRKTCQTRLSVYYEHGTRRCDLDVNFVIYLGPRLASRQREMERDARAAQTAKQSAETLGVTRAASTPEGEMEQESRMVLV